MFLVLEQERPLETIAGGAGCLHTHTHTQSISFAAPAITTVAAQPPCSMNRSREIRYICKIFCDFYPFPPLPQAFIRSGCRIELTLSALTEPLHGKAYPGTRQHAFIPCALIHPLICQIDGPAGHLATSDFIPLHLQPEVYQPLRDDFRQHQKARCGRGRST